MNLFNIVFMNQGATEDEYEVNLKLILELVDVDACQYYVCIVGNDYFTFFAN